MAEDSHAPPAEPTGLPRRTPGAGGLTPGQTRRGFLSPLIQSQTAPPGEAAESPPAEATSEPAQRVDPPSPATLAASASMLVRATSGAEIAAAAAAELAAAAAPRRPDSVSGSTVGSVAGSAGGPATQSSVVTAPPAPAPSTVSSSVGAPESLTSLELEIAPPAAPRRGDVLAQPGGRRDHPRAAARRWQLAGLGIAVVLMIGAVFAVIASHRPPRPHRSVAGETGSQRLTEASAIRNQAVGWVATEVGRDVSVACDPATCSALAARGFPASNLTPLQPTAPDPYGSVLVIATADIRSQFGSKLGAVYAPQLIASFGTGIARIDIRAIAPLGPATYSSALSADLAARKSSGAELLRNPRITVATGARVLLTDGLIDSRLLTTIAFLAAQDPIDIVGFGGVSPGATAVPLRSVYIAESDPAAEMTSSRYVQSLEAALRRQDPPYVPLSAGSVHLGGGPPVLQVEFAAPSPVGLLHS